MSTNKTLLRQLGFSANESKMYLSLLQHGPLSPAQLASRTGINRATVYAVAKTLQAKQVLQEDLAGRGVTYVAKHPSALSQLLQADRAQLAQKEQQVAAAMQKLSSISVSDEHPIPKIRFIEEARVRDTLYTEARTWDASAQEHDSIWWGVQSEGFSEQYADWIEWLWEHVHKTTEVRLLSPSSDIEGELAQYLQKRTVRHLPDLAVNATLWVAGDYVLLVATDVSPTYLVQLHDPLFAEQFRQMCKALWERGVE